MRIVGRADDQLKIRGFRIEPGEIEHLLARHPGVAEAAVRAFGDGGEATALVGYIRPVNPADPPDIRSLRLHPARSAPPYMIPAWFVILDDFPRTANGKLNRAALPAPVAEPYRDHVDQPACDQPEVLDDVEALERRIAAIVAEVLGRPTVGVHEDFFTLGGDSLRAVQIVLRLNEELDTEVPINALFESCTVYGLAAQLADGGPPEPRPWPSAEERGRRLSAAQWRL